jgi:hypothetical protein
VKSIKNKVAAIAVALGVMGAASATHAVTSLTFDFDVTGAGFTGSVGTMTVTKTASGLDFKGVLDSGYEFRNNPNGQPALMFNLPTADTDMPETGLTGPFKQLTGVSPYGGAGLSTLGTWNNAIACPKGKGGGACQPGYHDGVNPTTIGFSIAGITLADLVPDTAFGKKVYFSTDVVDSHGNTGYVGATLNGAVPEPATWAMMLVGFGGLGAALRSRRKQVVSLA